MTNFNAVDLVSVILKEVINYHKHALQDFA